MANALFFSSPFFISILAMIFLKEQIGIRRWIAISVGFVGVYIVLNPDFENLRVSFFEYHRNGMDHFTEKPDLVRETIADALIKLLDVYNQRPKGYLIQLFFDAKTDEIVNVFSQGTLMQANELVNVLTRISPKNVDKWQKILTSN